jgi:hypothetical protein
MGFLLAALPWAKRFGPWIIVGLIAVGVYAAGTMLIKDWKKSIHDTAYTEGEKTERDRQDAIARRIEAVLGPKLEAIDAKTGNQLIEQAKKEIIYVDRIKTKIASDPRYANCAVDDGMLGDRNEIRRSLETTLNPTAGTGSGTETNKTP